MGKHKHYDVIVAAAEGKEIQSRWDSNHPWETMGGHRALNGCTWYEDHQYRIKPEVQYPCTRMTEKELRVLYDRNCGNSVHLMTSDIANAAIRRAIEDGDVILPTKD